MVKNTNEGIGITDSLSIVPLAATVLILNSVSTSLIEARLGKFGCCCSLSVKVFFVIFISVNLSNWINASTALCSNGFMLADQFSNSVCYKISRIFICQILIKLDNIILKGLVFNKFYNFIQNCRWFILIKHAS